MPEISIYDILSPKSVIHDKLVKIYRQGGIFVDAGSRITFTEKREKYIFSIQTRRVVNI